MCEQWYATRRVLALAPLPNVRVGSTVPWYLPIPQNPSEFGNSGLDRRRGTMDWLAPREAYERLVTSPVASTSTLPTLKRPTDGFPYTKRTHPIGGT